MHDVPLIPFCPFPGTESGATNPNYSFTLSLLTALSFPRNGVRGYQSELFFGIIFAHRSVVSPERSPGLPIRIILLHYLCPPFCRFPGTESGATNQNYSFALSLPTVLSFPRNGVRGYQSELFFYIIFAHRSVISPERSQRLPIRIILLHYLCSPWKTELPFK